MSVQFASLAKYSHVHIGLLWEKFRDRFPRFEYHPPLPPTYETFGLGAPNLMRFSFAMAPDVPRVWLTNNDDNQLIQFQRDRFVHNWRKLGEADQYPRYESIRDRFMAELQELDSFLQGNAIGPIIPNQCELTYINIIKADAESTTQTSRVLTSWNDVRSDKLGECEDVNISARYYISSGDNPTPIGRLNVQWIPVVDQTGNKAIQMSLIGRGPPSKPTSESVLEFMDLARLKIVYSFAALTTEEMHRVWGRKT